MARTSSARKPYERPSSRTTEGLWMHDRAPGVPSAVLNTTGKATGTTVDTKLVVSNLHYNITSKDLIDIFGQVGTLVDEPKIKLPFLSFVDIDTFLLFGPVYAHARTNIQYDKSGRSTGIAFIHYETAAEASKAMRNYDGKLAKGERMSIAYDAHRHPGTRRVVSAPGSLADRIQKPPLLARLGAEPAKKAKDTSSKAPTETGPVRTKKSKRGGATGGNPRPEKFKKEAKTQEDLDKELDAFMAEDAPVPKPAETNGGDIEMA
ncbi:hypothetical protein SCHPADRAFT_939589 [Schizopora paradoxa]|uniref:RRM domain-containing protein n=1 Tax=Schizopora paradoxa TaxID=27342 RepID=A0A0H2RY52_9AGAM|nr:hypothetical protein SCHPADRAFT_939589 [Schizopora paradoxa]